MNPRAHGRRWWRDLGRGLVWLIVMGLGALLVAGVLTGGAS